MAKRKNPLDKLTAEQRQAVIDYAKAHGDDWQRKLRRDWMRAGSSWDGPYHLLQQVRNSHGPSWLAKVRPSDLEQPVVSRDMATVRTTDINAKAGDVFTVTGRGSFPLDMLRHDLVCPANDRAVVALHESIAGSRTPEGWQADFVVEVVAASDGVIAVERWRTFGCRIEPRSDYERRLRRAGAQARKLARGEA
jgi:hypothetical protein